MTRVCKLIILGDSGVGKTTLIHNFISQEFRADFKATLGADLSTKTFEINGKQVEAQIWDTAGTERFRAMGSSYYRGADACILVFDITSSDSFHHLNEWRKDFIDNADIEDPEMYPFVLFANKSDLTSQRKVSIEEEELWAKQKNCPFYDVSAKTSQNVEEGFLKAIELYLEFSKQNVLDVNIVPLDSAQPQKASCC